MATPYVIVEDDDDHDVAALPEPAAWQHITAPPATSTAAYIEPSALPAKLTRETVIQAASTFKPLKPLNFSLIRWNLLWLLCCFAFILIPLYAPFIGGCHNALIATASVLLVNFAVWIIALFFTLLAMFYVYKGMHTDHTTRYPPTLRLYHILVLTIYKDEMDVIERTLDSIAKQSEAKRIILNIAWESRTPDINARTERIRARYATALHEIIFTVHPFLVAHEIASKAANANYGLRCTVAYLFSRIDAKVSEYMVSTCDSDTLFHERYFEALTADYYEMCQRHDTSTHTTIWQAPLLYNWSLEKASVFVRVTSLLRTTMTAGLLIPFAVNPMSCFSFSLQCAVRAGFWHPQIFMDDVGFLMTVMCGSQSSIHMRLLPVPVISGPTSGATWWLDVYEWYMQVRRWAIGTADNFHFFIVHLHHLPIIAAIRFAVGYYCYYAIILCGASLFSVSAALSPLICPDNDWTLSVVHLSTFAITPSHLIMSLTILPYVCYLLMFVCDALWVRFILRIYEPIGLVRNIFHWLLTGPILIVLSFVQLYGYIVLAVRGKAACIHHLAGKAALGNISSINGIDRRIISTVRPLTDGLMTKHSDTHHDNKNGTVSVTVSTSRSSNHRIND